MAKTRTEEVLTEEIEKMVGSEEFQDQKGEFRNFTHRYAERSGRSENEGWALMKKKVIEILPAYISDGMIVCSLEKIAEKEPCRKAMEKGEEQLVISPGKGFPAVKFPTFYPYLDFILRAGPVDICHMKTKFKVEGNLTLGNVTLKFQGKRITRIFGSATVDAKIFICKGEIPVTLHEFRKEIPLDTSR